MTKSREPSIDRNPTVNTKAQVLATCNHGDIQTLPYVRQVGQVPGWGRTCEETV